MKLTAEFRKHLIAWCIRHGIADQQAKAWFQNCKTSDEYVTALLQLHRNLTKKEATIIISKLLVGMELSKE